MTRISDLEKIARRSFIPELEKKGFQHYGKLDFSRIIGEGIVQLITGGISYGENLEFSITCYVPEYDVKRMDDFPSLIPLTTGGDLGEDFFAGTTWKVLKKDELEGVFVDVLEEINKYAEPWFSTITTRTKYIENLFPRCKRKLEENGRLEAVLKGSI